MTEQALRRAGERLEMGRDGWRKYPHGPLRAGSWAFWTDFLALVMVPTSSLSEPVSEAPTALSGPVESWLAADVVTARMLSAEALSTFLSDQLRIVRCVTCSGRGIVDCDMCAGKGGDTCECSACGHEHQIECRVCDDSGYFNCKACGGNSKAQPRQVGEFVVNGRLLARIIDMVAADGHVTMEQLKGGHFRLRPSINGDAWVAFIAPMREGTAAKASFDNHATWPVSAQATA